MSDVIAELREVEPFIWEVPIGYVEGMRVPGRIFGSPDLVAKAVEDKAVQQVANVATLPGIQVAALAMPDIHWGYGFPIGGVAATDSAGGIVSPGGVGFDIGCGVRLLRSDISFDEAKPRMKDIVTMLARRVPRGVGGKGRMRLSPDEMERVLVEGARFPLERGVGHEEDLELCEDAGTLTGADPDAVSLRAKERGADQLGSLGGGNHFLEVQVVDEIRDEDAARALRLFDGQICVMIHSGSRGVGHQACTDFVRAIDAIMPELGFDLPDRQLACVPLDHDIARAYMGAMAAAGNFARANRHVLAAGAREAFAGVFGKPSLDLGMHLVYDISHNLAKMEDHEIHGATKQVCVHRKGATRAFAAGHPELPDRYRDVGQPVLIPGSMGTASYVLTGLPGAALKSFASTCHGAGRAMSRTSAKKMMEGKDLKKQLRDQGILVAAMHEKSLTEEAPYAYKDVSDVVESCERAGLTRVVARLRPVGVIKG